MLNDFVETECGFTLSIIERFSRCFVMEVAVVDLGGDRVASGGLCCLCQRDVPNEVWGGRVLKSAVVSVLSVVVLVVLQTMMVF